MLDANTLSLDYDLIYSEGGGPPLARPLPNVEVVVFRFAGDPAIFEGLGPLDIRALLSLGIVDGSSVISGERNEVSAGAHSVGETQDPGYAATIGGDCTPDGTITLNAGDDAHCTITNDDIQRAVFLVIDEDSIDNGNPPNFFSSDDVNENIAEIGLRAVLPFFEANPGSVISLHTGFRRRKCCNSNF